MNINDQYTEQPGFRPLYQQVRDLLVSRISTGAWRPAEALPSEIALARELNVSQGTVRKAIDALVADKLIERRQGKGTYVAKHTRESAQFRFFKLSHDNGERVFPTCKQSTIKRRAGTASECKKLDLPKSSDVYEILRTRFVGNMPVLREKIIVPFSKFANLDSHQPLPNTLYTLYQEHFNISINSTDEKLKAALAGVEIARELKIKPNDPVLNVERLGRDVTGATVELRQSIFLTNGLHYALQLT